MIVRLLPLLSFGCVRFGGLPDMPPSSGAGDPRAYASEKKLWAESVRQARIAVRSQNISWVLSGTDGEQLAGADELRERFGGIIFVGDSQIREIAWAGFQMLITGRQDLRFYPKDAVFKPRNKMKAVHQLHSSCVPQSVGKTGFTAACPTLASGEPCNLHSPFPNKTYAEKMRKLLLTKPHNWDGVMHARCPPAHLHSLPTLPVGGHQSARVPSNRCW